MTHSDFYLEIAARREDVPLFETSQYLVFFHYINFQSSCFECHLTNRGLQTKLVLAEYVGTIVLKIWLSSGIQR